MLSLAVDFEHEGDMSPSSISPWAHAAWTCTVPHSSPGALASGQLPILGKLEDLSSAFLGIRR